MEYSFDFDLKRDIPLTSSDISVLNLERCIFAFDGFKFTRFKLIDEYVFILFKSSFSVLN